MRNSSLSFDGKGINQTSKASADGYNHRIATLSQPQEAFQQQMGHLFAHAPEILQEFRYYVERARRIHERRCEKRPDSIEEQGKRDAFEKRLKWQELLIAHAEGRTSINTVQPTKRPQRIG